MLYTPLTKKALHLCFQKHKNQLDKSGMPYVFHPFHVAEAMTDEYSICTALLHDVAEDTDITLAQLCDMGFPHEVIDAISAMTHNDDTDYFDYVRSLKNNPIAKAVKLADLEHNSDLSRLDTVTEKDIQRFEKYKKAIEILKA